MITKNKNYIFSKTCNVLLSKITEICNKQTFKTLIILKKFVLNFDKMIISTKVYNLIKFKYTFIIL